jgi:hypothetical protein
LKAFGRKASSQDHFGKGWFLVVHPLDDYPEEKLKSDRLAPLETTPVVRWSLFALRAYLNVMIVLCFEAWLETLQKIHEILVGRRRSRWRCSRTRHLLLPDVSKNSAACYSPLECRLDDSVEVANWSMCHRESVEQFCAELEEQYQRPAAIYLPASDPRLLRPRTVRLHHRRGVKVLSPNGLPVKCVDRTSHWGNPFEIGKDGTREEVIQKYRDWFLTGTEPRKVGRYTVDPRRLRDHIHELRGFNLACCRPELPCHADFLLEQARPPEQILQGATET